MRADPAAMPLAAMPLAAVPFVGLAVGMILLRIGRRGRAVDDHPVCRRCRFDLAGLPSTSITCSECGADLRRKNAYLYGNHRPRPIAVALGLLLSVAATGWLCLLGWRFAGTLDYQRYKPVSWLAREAAGRDAPRQSAALGELVRRLGAGRLTAAQVDDLLGRALAHQADRSQTWVPEWGQFVEAAHRSGKAPRDQWNRYIRQALAPRLELRAVIGDGDELPCRLDLGIARTRSESVAFRITSATFQVDGGAPAPLDVPGIYITPPDPGESCWPLKPIPLAGDGSAFPPPGTHTLSLHLVLEWWDQVSIASHPLAESKMTLQSAFRTLPPGVPSVTAVRDPSYGAAVKQSLRIYHLTFGQIGTGWAAVTLDSAATPVGLSYDVFARCGAKQWPMGQVTRRRGGGRETFRLKGHAPGLDLHSAELVLRPSVDAAKATLDLDEAWDGEVVLPLGQALRAGVP